MFYIQMYISYKVTRAPSKPAFCVERAYLELLCIIFYIKLSKGQTMTALGGKMSYLVYTLFEQTGFRNGVGLDHRKMQK